MSEWDKLWTRRPHTAWTTKTNEEYLNEVKAEGDNLNHTVKALKSWLNDHCKVCLKAVTDCENCNYGGFKKILEGSE